MFSTLKFAESGSIVEEAAQLNLDIRAAFARLAQSVPWTPAVHPLLPEASRARAAALVRLGYAFSRGFAAHPFPGAETVMLDLWRSRVLPHAVSSDRRAADLSAS